MCGIVGIIDLAGRRTVGGGRIRSMADAITHRGPDEDGYLERPGLALGSRRLSIVGLADGRQPISNEDGTVWVVFNGELFDFPEVRAELQARGHTFRTSTDTELIPHLWEEYGEGMFAHLSGQFAFALWDSRTDELILARDRVGICPLFWTVRKGDDGADLFLFASEIKGLLASGLVEARADLTGGLNHVLTFFAVPGPATCFEGVNALLPGRFLRLKLGDGQPLPVGHGRPYWQISFPDWGDERDPGGPESRTIDEFEAHLLRAVSLRLRADVPVVSYLSGGVDSATVVALASKVLGRPVPTFTVSVRAEGLDEEGLAAGIARHLGSESVVVPFHDQDLKDRYPDLIRAAECPVIDTSCPALLMLARGVHERGIKVALTGEGSDEWLAGYPWFKTHRLLSALDVIPGVKLSIAVRRLMLRLTGQPRFPREVLDRSIEAVGGYNGWLDVYGLMSRSKLWFLRPDLRERVFNEVPYEQIELNPDLKRWHPFNRSLYLGGRVMLAGHLLCSKGDRVAMNSSVETRYPFLDEKVIEFLCGLHPRWKLRGLRDKYILRRLARRWLPEKVAMRRKGIFRAPMDTFDVGGGTRPGWVDQVLSPESLNKAGYFDAASVNHWRANIGRLRRGSLKRTSLEMGLVAVAATQLWHHIFISGDLCDV